MRVSLEGFELQNIVKDARGLRTRGGLQSIKTPTAGTVFVAGFTIESPFTSEPWHYLVEQSSTTAVCTLRVFTEEFLELFSHNLGPLQLSPVVTYGVQTNQIQINSPAFSRPLYGLVGGGITNLVKATSENADTTALDVPSGHVCAFGDRLPIAAGNLVYFNDPGIDPRSYVAENIASFPGSIYDMCQGPGGGLYVFTSAGVYVMSADALGQGQDVSGFISRVPGLETTRSRNAASSNGTAAVLTKTGIQIMDGKHVQVLQPRTRRYWSKVVDVEDLRRAGELFPTPRGFIVGFNAHRGVYLEVDTVSGVTSWVTNTTASLNVAGTLRGRDGDLMVVLRDRVVKQLGNVDYTGDIRGVASGTISFGDDMPTVRRITVKSSNIASTVGAAVNGDVDSDTSPTRSTDAVIGTALWGTSTNHVGRDLRSTRLSFSTRAESPHMEVRVDGGNREIDAKVEVDLVGQGIRERSDKHS